MLVAPSVLSERPLARRRDAARRRIDRATPRARGSGSGTSAALPILLVWLALGCSVLLCAPVARTSALLGASVPFWLVAAPLIDLAWLERARLRRAWSKRRRVRAAGAVRVARVRVAR